MMPLPFSPACQMMWGACMKPRKVTMNLGASQLGSFKPMLEIVEVTMNLGFQNYIALKAFASIFHSLNILEKKEV